MMFIFRCASNAYYVRLEVVPDSSHHGSVWDVVFKVFADVFVHVLWISDMDGYATSKYYVRQTFIQAQYRYSKGSMIGRKYFGIKFKQLVFHFKKRS